MKAFKTILSLAITVSLVYALNRSWTGLPGVDTLPALGKLLDPFHGFWQNAESSPIIPDELTISGLKNEVKVVYDSMLIPHIFATNDEDLYFTQGYVTASQRLWQMETQILAGAGRLAEVLGPGLLPRDRSQRRIGMVYAAQRALEKTESDPTTKAVLDSYTAGINAYIQTLDDESLPFEYKLLNYRPEPWTNFKSAMLLKNMAQTLNLGEKDKEMTMALQMFGMPVVDVLWPDNEHTDPIVDRTGQWKFPPVKVSTPPMAFDSLPTVAMRASHEKSSKDVGSNNWAVSGTKTATGSPLLCNDPHLNLSLPSIWFAIRLHSPSVNVMGSSLPGAPGVVIGFNDSIAWGVTNAQRDLVDYYRVKFKDLSLNEYWSDGQWRKATKVVETFQVRGQAPFVDTVTYTHIGPIPNDKSFNGPSSTELDAFRWVSHDPSDELKTFYLLNRGKNHGDYMKALDNFHSPAQNFVFASVAGDIAMRIQGKYPVRRQNEGKFILDGTRTDQEWQAFIPFEQNVMDKNPPRGFVSSANQYPADATYPYYVTAQSYEAYRNRRINQVLTEISGATPKDMMKLQLDNYNLKAAESLPYFLAQLDTTKLTEAEQQAWKTLKAWDYVNDIHSLGASYYEAWWDALMPLAWDELSKDPKHPIDYPTAFNTIRLLKEQPTLSFFDITSTPTTETAKELLQTAFKIGVEDVEKWKLEKKSDPEWATFKGTVIRHLAQLPPLSVSVAAGGNHDIVNATSRTHGPSWRMVVSLEKTGLKAWGVYPGGQSGNPGSKYYSNMIDMWAKGNYFSLPFVSAEALAARSLGTTQLKPASK